MTALKCSAKRSLSILSALLFQISTAVRMPHLRFFCCLGQGPVREDLKAHLEQSRHWKRASTCLLCCTAPLLEEWRRYIRCWLHLADNPPPTRIPNAGLGTCSKDDALKRRCRSSIFAQVNPPRPRAHALERRLRCPAVRVSRGK